MVNPTKQKFKNCAKNTLREWDRFGSEVYVHGLGIQPIEPNKKYNVDMQIYKHKKTKPKVFTLSEQA